MHASHEWYMRLALQQAELAYHAGEVPIGAVVVHIGSGRVLARAFNQTGVLHDPTAHAEMLAITAATQRMGGKYLEQCALYVTVEPCPMCAGAMLWGRVGCLVFGASDAKKGYTCYAPQILHPRTTVVGGVLGQECQALMQHFFQARR